GACYKLSIFITLGIQAFRYAAEPFFFSEAKNKNAPELFANVMNWFVIACCIVFLIISVNLDLFLLLLRQAEYREGGMVVPVLLLANLFLGIYYNLSVWYKLKDKTHYGMYISIGGAVITIFLNLALIPFWGYMGCAVATLICYFLMAAACYFYGKKYLPVPYDLKSGFGYILGAVLLVVIALSRVPGIESNLSNHLFHNFLILVYLVVVWFIVRSKFFRKKG
ncbi:MAG: polysaccharide biosynthesis C-terminal domain-containing protein, partial [Bacteroidetes bacterium]|nr:polysaccharide biosynthesis C-terminal domain-containing protein [Bacteroidota bacterium]